MTKLNTAAVRKARVSDVPVMADIINRHAKNGVMLPRPLSRIYDCIRDYMVVEDGDEVVGCGALHVMWSDLAEIRAVALKNEYAGQGLGRALIDSLLAEARSLGIEKVFVLTYQDAFFGHLGFRVIDKSQLPHKIWTECVNCVHFPNCNEIAMLNELKGGESA